MQLCFKNSSTNLFAHEISMEIMSVDRRVVFDANGTGTPLTKVEKNVSNARYRWLNTALSL